MRKFRRKSHAHKVQKKLLRKNNPVNKLLVALISGLLVFGIIMIYDATVVYSQNTFGESHRFVLLQIIWVLLGICSFCFFYKFDYKKIRRLAYPFFGLSVLFLFPLSVLGFFTRINVISCSTRFSFAPCINGAYRWLYINAPPLPQIPFIGIIGFQPSELAKFALILYLSVQIPMCIKRKRNAFSVFIFSALLTSFLIMLQPNMSTAVLVFLIGSLIYFASGAPIVPLFVSFPILSIGGLILMLTSSYRRTRLLTLLGLLEDTDLSASYHIKQILVALGSGGLFGVGFGQSRQKYQYLPEVSSDSIFAVIGEELGFLGTTIVVFVFALLIHKGYTIACRTQDALGRLLAIGITSWIGLQFFMNVAAMVKLLPLTGIPIPFISYGGSSTIFILSALGILANISSQASDV